MGHNPCTKFGIDQVKESKDIERKTQWAQKSGLTLTFEHVTWKSIGIIYELGATPVPSLVLIQWSGQRMLSGQHLVYRPTDRPIDRHTERPTVAKQYAPFFKGGGGIKRGCCILNLEAPDSIAYFYFSLLSYYKTNKMRVWQKFSKAVNNLNANIKTISCWAFDWPERSDIRHIRLNRTDIKIYQNPVQHVRVTNLECFPSPIYFEEAGKPVYHQPKDDHVGDFKER